MQKPSFLKVYDLKKIHEQIKIRSGETKLGEKFQFLDPEGDFEEQLENSDSKYVLFGIEEDIGVIGNHGVAGARNAWKAALPSILNLQYNDYIKGKKVLLLGHMDFDELYHQLSGLEGEERTEKAREITNFVDKQIVIVVNRIVSAGKIPIVIGGGHNNAYGNIKGASLALGKPVNALNFDAHTDFRKRESRHSGNGFSYAWYEGFLQRYFIFGLHENYTPKKVFKKLLKENNIAFNTFEEISVRQEKGLEYQISEGIDFVKSNSFGLEIDLDAISDMPSSAMTPSGFDLNVARNLVFKASRSKNIAWLHICEGLPGEEGSTDFIKVGKAIALLVADFLRK
ncbi:formimidoylglutamase [Robertkochia aurantiaca]|uniref:formimidoylglutamase n=1 Tax=Robertkochia aurantiaca TaxID=2873700 RepID=UPI001CCED0ED|nr:formimidoylglutamase [Robertkochia sp. 3YJGBD-33]